MITKERLRFFRTDQEPGDPRRAYVHIGFERVGDGVTTTGDVGSVHPQFAPAIAQVPAMVDYLRNVCRVAEDVDCDELTGALDRTFGQPRADMMVLALRESWRQARAILAAMEGEQ